MRSAGKEPFPTIFVDGKQDDKVYSMNGFQGLVTIGYVITAVHSSVEI